MSQLLFFFLTLECYNHRPKQTHFSFNTKLKKQRFMSPTDVMKIKTVWFFIYTSN